MLPSLSPAATFLFFKKLDTDFNGNVSRPEFQKMFKSDIDIAHAHGFVQKAKVLGSEDLLLCYDDSVNMNISFLIK